MGLKHPTGQEHSHSEWSLNVGLHGKPMLLLLGLFLCQFESGTTFGEVLALL